MGEELPLAGCLTSVDSSRNRYRIYRLMWQPTLWGEDVLVQTWGRLGTDGRSRICFLTDAQQAQTAMTELVRRRFLHGYAIPEPALLRAQRATVWRGQQAFAHAMPEFDPKLR